MALCSGLWTIARGILADYDFPAGSGLDQLFAASIKKFGFKPEWAEKFRAQTGESAAGSSAGVSQVAPSSLPVALGIDEFVVVPQVNPAMIPGSGLLDRVVIGNNDLFIARETDEQGFYPLSRPDPTQPGRLVQCGRLSPEGVYHIEEPAEIDYIAINGHFYRSHFNEQVGSLTIIKSDGSREGALRVEPSGPFRRMGQWRLELTCMNLSSLHELVKQILPSTATDIEIARYIERYSRQINKVTQPLVRWAHSVDALETEVERFLNLNGLPVPVLSRLLDTLAKGLPPPEGLPIYDELQGLQPLRIAGNRSISLRDLIDQGSFLTIKPTPVDEVELVQPLISELSHDAPSTWKVNKLMHPLINKILQRKGYVILEERSDALFRQGIFSKVFRGPNGDLYVMKIKRVRDVPNLNIVPAFIDQFGHFDLEFSDDRIDSIVTRELRRGGTNASPTLVALRQAREAGRLFKVIAVVRRDGEIFIFRAMDANDL